MKKPGREFCGRRRFSSASSGLPEFFIRGGPAFYAPQVQLQASAACLPLLKTAACAPPPLCVAETPGEEFRAREAEFRAQEAEFCAQEAEFCAQEAEFRAQEAECGGSERLGGLKEFLSDGGKHAGAFWQIFALPRKRTGPRSCPENYADRGGWLGWR